MNDKPEIKNPQMQGFTKPRRDWESLLMQFMANEEYNDARTWLRVVKGWSEKTTTSGNVNVHISGWGKRRANYRQRIRDRAMEKVRRKLENQHVRLYEGKFNALDELLNRLEPTNVKEEKTIGIIASLKVIKTEVGEPNYITVIDATVKHTPNELPEAELERLIKDAHNRTRRNSDT